MMDDASKNSFYIQAEIPPQAWRDYRALRRSNPPGSFIDDGKEVPTCLYVDMRIAAGGRVLFEPPAGYADDHPGDRSWSGPDLPVFHIVMRLIDAIGHLDAQVGPSKKSVIAGFEGGSAIVLTEQEDAVTIRTSPSI